jgi:hypothetical protein
MRSGSGGKISRRVDMTLQAVAALSPSGGTPDTEAVSEGTYVPDILLQILLPIVLILAYMAGGPAQAAPDAAKIDAEQKLRGQLAAAYLELQRQRLVAGLERVSAERKQELGLFYLASKTLQLNPGGGLGDQDDVLVKSCRALEAVLGTDELRNVESQQLFQRVLIAAGLTTGPEFNSESVRTSDPVQASLTVTSENRKFAVEKIQLFLQSLESDAVREQTRLIDDVFRQYRLLPLDVRYQIVPETRGIQEQLTAINKQGGDITALADGLASALYRKIKQDFESQGYGLLAQAWSSR